MGAKRTSKLIAVFVALALMMTSGVSVFAAGSPTKGATPVPTSVEVASTTSIAVTTSAPSAQYRIAGKKWKSVAVTNGVANITGLKKHKKYQVKIADQSFYKLTCKGKIKSAKKKGKTVTVKIAKRKCAKKYVITCVRADGKVVKKTVKSLTAKLKLEAGTWTITVAPKSGKYVGKASAAKTVTIG